jgi:hypothetical protein
MNELREHRYGLKKYDPQKNGTRIFNNLMQRGFIARND